MLKQFAAAIGLVFLVPAALAQSADDSVHGMCAELAPPDACQCAADALLAEIGADDYALYEGIGADYLARMAAGETRVDAWTAASDAAAAGIGQSSTQLMTRTNKFGSAHRAAIIACSG